MNKKEKSNPKEPQNQNYEFKKMNTSQNIKKKKDEINSRALLKII